MITINKIEFDRIDVKSIKIEFQHRINYNYQFYPEKSFIFGLIKKRNILYDKVDNNWRPVGKEYKTGDYISIFCISTAESEFNAIVGDKKEDSKGEKYYEIIMLPYVKVILRNNRGCRNYYFSSEKEVIKFLKLLEENNVLPKENCVFYDNRALKSSGNLDELIQQL